MRQRSGCDDVKGPEKRNERNCRICEDDRLDTENSQNMGSKTTDGPKSKNLQALSGRDYYSYHHHLQTENLLS